MKQKITIDEHNLKTTVLQVLCVCVSFLNSFELQIRVCIMVFLLFNPENYDQKVKTKVHWHFKKFGLQIITFCHVIRTITHNFFLFIFLSFFLFFPFTHPWSTIYNLIFFNKKKFSISSWRNAPNQENKVITFNT